MKILYLTTGCFDKGGVSRFSRYQADALRTLYGAENVRVISRLGPDEHAFEEPFDVTWHGGSGTGIVAKARFVAAVTKQALLWHPDVILSAHIHYSALAHRLSRIIKAKSFLNIYGLEVWSSPGKAALWGLRQMDQVIADCHNTADFVVEHDLRPKGRPTVIWDPVDVNRFSPSECPLDVLQKYCLYDKRRHFVVLSLGRLSIGASHKGYDRLIKVFSKVADSCPNARLVICGRGDNSENLKALAEQEGVAEKVRFPGGIDEVDLADVYRSGTIFSLVSDQGDGRGEGIPMTPLEAMSCGVPIIVGNQDGSREAIIDGENGFCIDPFDLDNHAEIIRSLIADRTLLAAKCTGAVSVAKNVFSFQRFIKEHADLLAEIE